MTKYLKNPEVSIVVCHHVGDLLLDFLQSVTYSESVSYEVIIMTSDEKLAREGISGCMTFHNTGLPAEKRNAGARVAIGKYLAFFDDDVTIDPLCLYHLKDGIKDDIAMTYGKLWNMEHRNRFDEAGGYLTSTGFIWSRAGQNDIDNGQYNNDEYIFAGKSASCMVRKDVFKQVGGFDEDFGILGEETLLSWRIWLQGFKVLYTPQATGAHAFNCPTIKPVKKHYTNTRVFFNGVRNYHSMLLQCLEIKNLWKIIPLHSMIWIGAGCAMLITGKLKEGYNIFKGLMYVMRNWKNIMLKRRKVQDNRVRTDSELWPYIYRNAPRGYYKTRILRYITLGLHG